MPTSPTPPHPALIRRPVPLLLLLGGSLVWADEAPPSAANLAAAPGSSVRRQITDLLVQEAKQAAAKPKDLVAPKLDPPVGEPDAPDDILQLETVRVSAKKPLELPLRLKPVTLENFFYGDGKIFESANRRFSISAGGTGGNGVAAIKFTIKF